MPRNNLIQNLQLASSQLRIAIEKRYSQLMGHMSKYQDQKKDAYNPFEYLDPPSYQPHKIINHAFYFILVLVVVLFLSFGLTAGYGYYLINIDRPHHVDATFNNKLIIKVPKNATATDIATELYQRGLISHVALFHLAAKIFQSDKSLHAGIFALKPGMTIKEILDIITGKNAAGSMTTFTIPEGFSYQEIARLLDQKQVVSANEFVEYTKFGALGALSDTFFFLSACPIPSMEGYLYPDTYVLVPGLSAHQLARIMVERFYEKIYAYYVQHRSEAPMINNHQLTFHELLTLASIVEKEAVVDRERPLIAAVFLNRLKFGMAFGSDPTVKYALGDTHRPMVTYEDIKTDSPYNTYRYKGLPPGPIASPGLKSFVAVMSPQKTDYLYFIAKGDGTHSFSRTLQEHDNLRSKLGYNR